MPTVHYLLKGHVQGIGFRRFALHHAVRLNLNGYVSNLDSGDVECVAQGSAESLTELEMLLRQGPRGADVHSVSCTDLSDERKYKQFRIV